MKKRKKKHNIPTLTTSTLHRTSVGEMTRDQNTSRNNNNNNELKLNHYIIFTFH